MKSRNEMDITRETENENILSSKKDKKNKGKKSENKFFKNLKDSIFYRPQTNSKQKLNNKLQQVTTNTNTKKVKFNKDITIIDVENWKDYNKEQTSQENSDEDDDVNKKKKKKNNKNSNKKDNISCACIII